MPPKKETTKEIIPVECLVCADTCSILGVFAACGHYLCYTCALRIHALDNKGCPVCRVVSESMYITQQAPASEDCFDLETELQELKSGKGCIQDKRLKCIVENQKLAEHMRKLYEFVCPLPQCWRNGEQEPFVQENMLKEHLLCDHQQKYCKICLKDKRVFLAEQNTYNDREYEQHVQGRCSSLDAESFQGHPMCKFCSDRFYDGEHLLKHMQHAHFSCDVCNRGEFTFTYYKNRDRLLEHFQRAHKLCDHKDCAHLDPMLRVFHSDLELQAHRQRAHNIQTRGGVSLDALGFRFSYAADAPAALQSPTTTSAPATATSGSNSTNALRVTFDHISRVEVVDTMPNVNGKTQHNGRSGRAGNQQQSKDRDAGSIRRQGGVPDSWRDPRLTLAPLKIIVERSTPAVSSAPAKMPSWGSAPGADKQQVAGSSSNRGAESSATAVADMKRGFEERLNRYFSNPNVLVNFRHACSDFLSNRLLAAEFYNALEKTYFAKRPHELDDFFPYLIATMPNSAKAEGLQTVRQMRSAPELQRQKKSNEEDEARARESGGKTVDGKTTVTDLESKLQRSRLNAQKISNAQNKRNAAWSSQAPPAAVSSPEASPPVSQAAVFPSGSWGASSGSHPAPFPSTTTHADPTDFPSLPTGGGRSIRQVQSAKPAAKHNAWFRK